MIVFPHYKKALPGAIAPENIKRLPPTADQSKQGAAKHPPKRARLLYLTRSEISIEKERKDKHGKTEQGASRTGGGQGMIYANWRSAPAELITPQEITAIMERAGTVEDIKRAHAIAQEYIKVTGITTFKNDHDWHYLCMLSNIYQAGRIQGIREQRAAHAVKEITHTHTHRITAFARWRLIGRAAA